MLDEGGAGPIDHVEHPIESVGAPVVGIRHIELAILMGVELSEEGEQGASLLLGLKVAQVLEIGAIHREYVVELVEVLDAHTASPPSECNSVAYGDLSGAWVGGLSQVPRPRACRVHADPVREVLFFQTMRQDALSQRRTADVAQAYEKNGDVGFGGHRIGFSKRAAPLKVWNPGAYP